MGHILLAAIFCIGWSRAERLNDRSITVERYLHHMVR
jgi:hypothetical protein